MTVLEMPRLGSNGTWSISALSPTTYEDSKPGIILRFYGNIMAIGIY